VSQMSDYLEDAIRNWFKGTVFPTVPANTYLGLYTAAPSDSGGGTEVSGNAYARQPIVSSAAGWTSGGAGTGSISNAAIINFPAANPGAWGTVTHFGVFDAVTAGNLLMWNALGASKVVNIADVVQFAIGALVLTYA
jgi:hypothetical protein